MVPAHAAEPGGPPELKELKYRSIGPFAGGRICRSAGVPGDPLTYYAATAAGGVWKSTDGGTHWKPIFDDQADSSIGSIAVAPSDPNVLYAGTRRRPTSAATSAAATASTNPPTPARPGSTSGSSTARSAQMIVHPTNPDIAFAAVLGHAFGPNAERGVYRTTDGGKTWKQVLSKDADTGACDVCFDPTNPHILFAGLWQTRRRPWELTSGGPGSGLYVSATAATPGNNSAAPSVADDQLKGLPEGIWGKIGVAVAPSDGRRVYALIEAEKGGLFRSDDGGENWKLVNAGRYLRQRPWYFSPSPSIRRNPDVVWCPQVPPAQEHRRRQDLQAGQGAAPRRSPRHVDRPEEPASA